MRSSRDRASQAKDLLKLRVRWAERLDATYPAPGADGRRRHPGSWTHFDADHGGVQERLESRAFRAMRVGAGISGVVAGACSREDAWRVYGLGPDDPAAERALSVQLVQTVAGFEQVDLGLYGRAQQPYGQMTESAGPLGRVWPAREPVAVRFIQYMRRDFRVMPDPRQARNEGEQALIAIQTGQAPSGTLERIRIARGLRHLIAHGVLSPTKVREFKLQEWLDAAMHDLVSCTLAVCSSIVRGS
jgi:hypothetical protein